MEDNFRMYKKWFWVGMVVGFFNILAGIIFGLALITEEGHKKEGWIITLWSILSFAILFYVSFKLQQAGLLSPQQLLPPQL